MLIARLVVPFTCPVTKSIYLCNFDLLMMMHFEEGTTTSRSKKVSVVNCCTQYVKYAFIF